MKPLFCLLFITTSFTAGCSWKQSTQAIRHAIDAGNIEGLDATSKFAITFPDHGGPYKNVDILHVVVVEGPYQGQNATFYVGQSCRTGEWSVFAAMVQQADGTWQQVAVKELEQQQFAAR